MSSLEEATKALAALYLECGKEVAADIQRKVEKAFQDLEQRHRCFDPSCGRICPKCRIVYHPDRKLPEIAEGSQFSLPICPECRSMVMWLCALRATECIDRNIDYKSRNDRAREALRCASDGNPFVQKAIRILEGK